MCRQRNIATRDYQESLTTGQTHGQTDGQNDPYVRDASHAKKIKACRIVSTVYD